MAVSDSLRNPAALHLENRARSTNWIQGWVIPKSSLDVSEEMFRPRQESKSIG
jgi:hypothetical protein